MILAFFKYCYFWIDILGFFIQTFEPAPPPRMFSYGVPPWVIETESCENLELEECTWISEDQMHSLQVAKMHYRKQRSREVALKGLVYFYNNLKFI